MVGTAHPTVLLFKVKRHAAGLINIISDKTRLFSAARGGYTKEYLG